MKKVSFPFSYIGKNDFGKFYRPTAIVYFLSFVDKEWYMVPMVVDTGADYTTLPKKYAKIFGIDLEQDCAKEEMGGIGGTEIVYQFKGLKMKIGDIEKIIPVGFLGNGNVPPLLGRLRCLEDMKLVFEKFTSYFYG